MANGDHSNLWVSNGQLKEELDEVRAQLSEKPSRWEVRFLIVVAVLLAPSIPSAADVAQAAIGRLG